MRGGVRRRKEKRNDLFDSLNNALASECSPWYTPSAVKLSSSSTLTSSVNAVSPAVTSACIKPHVLLQHTLTCTPHHQAASVWTDEPTTPLSESSVFKQASLTVTHQLSAAVLSAACSLVKPLQAIRGTLYLTRGEFIFIVDPSFREERERHVAAMEEKCANGRRGENKWLLLDALKNENWEVGQLTSEEYRLYLVWQKSRRLWVAARCGRRAVLRERRLRVPRLRDAGAAQPLPRLPSAAAAALAGAVLGRDGGGALEERRELRAVAEGRAVEL